MANLTPKEQVQLEELFGMEDGHALEFSHASLRRFVLKAVNVDLDAPKYNEDHSGSKANRLRSLWDLEPDPVVALRYLLLNVFVARGIECRRGRVDYDPGPDLQSSGNALAGFDELCLVVEQLGTVEVP